MTGVEPTDPDSEFYFGCRQTVAYGTTAQPSYHYAPLTPADFLDPQPGDAFVRGPRHDADVQQLVRILRHVHRYAPFLTIFTGLKLVWDREGLAQPAPDIMVAPDVVAPQRPRAVFDVAAERTRPRFVLEVTSPRLVDVDLGPKVLAYAQAGVDEYFIVDSGQRADGDALDYRVLGYRLRDGMYAPLASDSAGCVYSEVNGVWIGPNAAHDGFVVISGRTGQPIPPTDEAPPLAATEAEAHHRASAIADQLSSLLGGPGL